MLNGEHLSILLWNAGFLDLLSQLTVVGEISKSQFEGKRQLNVACVPAEMLLSPLKLSVRASAERFQLLQTKQPDYYIVVLEGVAFRTCLPLKDDAVSHYNITLVILTHIMSFLQI